MFDGKRTRKELFEKTIDFLELALQVHK